MPFELFIDWHVKYIGIRIHTNFRYGFIRVKLRSLTFSIWKESLVGTWDNM